MENWIEFLTKLQGEREGVHMRKKYWFVLIFVTSVLIGAINPINPGTAVATDIYYSVGQNTSDHKTGSPTVTVSGTTMTFSAPQTAPNMGVGDVVSYGGNTCYISGRASSMVWSCVTATGGTPAAAAGATVNSISHAFASLNAALSGGTPGVADGDHLNTTDLAAENYNLFIPCYYDTGPDTTGTHITALTTDSTYGIKIYTPYLSSEVNQSQRHGGKWTTSAYRIELPIDSNLVAILTYAQNVWVEGLQIKVQDSAVAMAGISFEQGFVSGGLGQASKNIIWGTFSTSTNSNYGIYVLQSTTAGDVEMKIWNNIIYGVRQGTNDNNYGIFVPFGTQGYIYNNTIYGNYNGITSDQWGELGESVLIKNNLCNGNDIDYDAPNGAGAFDANSVNNISEDATSPNESFRSRTATFVSTTPGSEDFHLDCSDTAAREQGINLSGDPDLPFSDDIDGETRVPAGAWDIGADTSVCWTLTVNVAGSGTVTKDPDREEYKDGVWVKLTPAPAEGWTFSGWSGDLTGSANPGWIGMDADKTVTATFTINTYTVTANANGNGAGQMGSTPAGISYSYSGSPTLASASFNYDETVVLTASAGTGSTASWGTTCAAAGGTPAGNGSASATCTFTHLSATKSATATFTINTYTVTANANGNGAGQMGSTPAGISYSYSGSPTLASASFNYDETVVLTASAGTGSTASWGTTCAAAGGTPAGNGSASATCTFTHLSATKSATATFTINTYTVTANANGNGAGQMGSTPAGISYSYSGSPTLASASFNYDETVVLTASAGTGSTASWGTTCAAAGGTPAGNGSASATCTFTHLSATKSATATFTINTYTVTANANGNGAGQMGSTPAGISYSYSGSPTLASASFNYDETVVLTASAGTGSTASWGTTCAAAGGTPAGNGSASATCTFTHLSATKSATATFTINTYTVTANANGNGAGQMGSTPAGISYSYSGSPTLASASFNYDETVVLTASAGTGSTASWGTTCAAAGGTPAGNGSASATCTFTHLSATKSATATFTINTYTVTANANGNGAGQMGSTPAGISYSYSGSPTLASASFNYDETVVLTASAGTGSTASWGTTCAAAGGTPAGNGSASATCTFTHLSATKSATATFTINTYTVTANASGNGTGGVQSSAGAINYSYPAINTQTTTLLDYGTSVTLTAAAGTGSTASWGGTCTAAGGTEGGSTVSATCTFASLNGNKTAAATFTLNQYTVTATASGNGTGGVQSSAGAINYSYPANNTGTTTPLNDGTSVTLTAAAGTGSTASWGGTCVAAGGTVAGNGTASATCTFASLNGNKTATATFTLDQYQLTANSAGNGGGIVQSDVSGISYSYPTNSTGQSTFNYGTAVILTATVVPGSTVSWGEGCDLTGGTSTAATCTVSMTSAKTLTATFVFNDPAEFVKQQYRDFLNREADDGGLQFWVNMLNSGAMTKAEIIDYFLGSQEFEGTIAPIVRLYFAYFLRVPDYAGLMFWIGAYNSGWSLGSISESFAASNEFQQTYGSLTNEQFVTLVYQNVLGRDPDPVGYDYWLGQLNSGSLTWGQMMLGFSESDEYNALISNEVLVTMMYIGMLRRSPEPGGFNFWVGYLDSGGSELSMIDAFFSSQEYASRFL